MFSFPRLLLRSSCQMSRSSIPSFPSFFPSCRSFSSSPRLHKRGRLIDLIDLPTKSGSNVSWRGLWSWEEKPKTVLIVKREQDEVSSEALLKMTDWMKTAYPDVQILVDRETYSLGETNESIAHLDSYESPSPFSGWYRLLSERVDFVLTLGGDGTLLRACSLFKKDVPPILAFHMGTLGFMTNAKVDNFEREISRVLEGNFLCSKRARLLCTLESDDPNDEPQDLFRSLNEVAFASGTTRSVVVWLDVSINDQYVTTVQGDGLIVASPTGSTAYSLTCGGPITHPECRGMLLTPIAPRSLSFRPIMVPDDAKISVTVSPENRYGAVSMTFDGRSSMVLPEKRSLTVQTSKYSVHVVSIENAMSDWTTGMKERLKWNS
mmetsp:Transcript_19363/g.30328  ORF Transcript_19363/g.30328 Transcript_19363/m.30328 type:complete len:378 (-) Transcript_19363:1313-2446(-)